MSCVTTYTTKRIALSSRRGDPEEWKLLNALEPGTEMPVYRHHGSSNIEYLCFIAIPYQEIHSGTDWIYNVVSIRVIITQI